MTSPAHTTSADTSVPEKKVRRSRKAISLSIGLVAVVGIAFATTACTPQLVAKDAISQEWGSKNAACAEKIAQRESGLDATAVNTSSGATGLFQLMPLHKAWIKSDLGYDWSEMKDPYKNAEAAKLLSAKSYAAYKDGWAPWRTTGKAIQGGGCPA
ncbi:transglycosylase SLT domain-containing protein [Aquihabitans sp. McL0605]|uniref:transglycosylase SLT domain-containing protein n=1 Tax=Aquihabitans sp. McL0605 TaxID=3415671 RepID=UPI003CFA121C